MVYRWIVLPTLYYKVRYTTTRSMPQSHAGYLRTLQPHGAVTYDGCLSIFGDKIHLPDTGVVGICTLPESQVTCLLTPGYTAEGN